MTDPDLVLTGGRIRTLDPGRPSASAIAIAGGAIVAVGPDDEVRRLAGPRTERIDLGGATAVPGLIDSHSHALPSPLAGGGIDLRRARTVDEVRALVAQERERRGPDAWIFGLALDYNVFDGVDVDGALFEEAAGGGPALLRFVDCHTAIATPAALRLAGVDGPRRFDEHAEIVCVEGRPTGELREAAAIDVVQQAAPPATPEEERATAVENLRRFAAAGVTATHVMDGTLETLDLLQALEADAGLPVRLIASYWIKPDTPREAWARFAAQRDAGGRRWRAGIAKFFIDGVIDTGTGWLVEPDAEGDGLAPFWPDPARYREAVAFFAGHGFQCVTHACGDRAVREALDAYRDAPSAAGIRHRIEHIEVLQDADLPRFAAEGVIASMQAQHMMDLAPDRGDNWSRRVGPERCERAFPIRSLMESGATVILGSDWPVADLDPREGLAAARLRRAPGDTARAPYDDQAIDGLAALEGYTTRPAAAAGHGDRQGRIAPGYWADVTVLAEDPVTCDADDLPGVPVLLTVVDGEVVHRGGV